MVPESLRQQAGSDLETVVVVKAERVAEDHAVGGAPVWQCFKSLARARMCRDEDREPERVVDARQACEKGSQTLGRVDVLLPVRAHEEVFAFFEPLVRQDRRRVDAVAIGVQHLSHRRARLDDAARMKALGQQITSCMLGVYEIEVADMIDEPAVGLLWHVEVETSVARLHVVHRHLHAASHECCDARVRIPEHEKSVRSLGEDDVLHRRQGAAEHASETARVDSEHMVRLADPEILEEDLVQRVVVVLPRVHEDVLDRLVETSDDA